MNYIIVTPAKNEAEFIRYTLDSVINQTFTPQQWIIVDDGSSDDTFSIVQSYSREFPWIIPVKQPTGKEERSGGAKVVRAFNTGLSHLTEANYGFLVKLDADLTLPNDYFEQVASAFQQNPKLGICGGYIVHSKNGNLVQEGKPDYHIRGAFKAYRKECFEAIHGLREVWSWDGIDEMDAMFKGWELKTLNLQVVHHRPTSSAYNLYQHHLKSGIEAYRLRSSLFLTLTRTLIRLTRKPFILGGVYYFYGFLLGWMRKEKRIVDRDLATFINKFHLKRILPG